MRTLARLWQLQAKMQTVGAASSSISSSAAGGGGSSSSGSTGSGSGGSAYEARIERVCAVAGGIEERLCKRLELLDGYARVMNMIEIEVEMDMQVCVWEGAGWPVACVLGVVRPFAFLQHQ